MDSVKAVNHLPVPDYDVERLNQAATAFTSKGSRDGMRYMISLKKADYRPISVSLTPHPRKPRLTFSSPTRRQRSSRGSWRRTAASTRILPQKSSANVRPRCSDFHTSGRTRSSRLKMMRSRRTSKCIRRMRDKTRRLARRPWAVYASRMTAMEVTTKSRCTTGAIRVRIRCSARRV